MMNEHLKLFILCIFVLSFAKDSLQQMVTISLGTIQGSTMKSKNGSDIYAFRGIKYAKAPTGDLRFNGPEPVTAWTGTLQATTDSLVCPQTGVKTLMSEDCLALNVYSRNLTGKAPVIVYIHGGANVLGSGHSSYEAGPQYLLDHQVVFVSFNYRLGALGFLSTSTSEAPGNYGYLDQVLVLNWVRNHISHFGGDPNSVTIFGLSAGSMAVSLHLASPISRGLFHRAILMSGSATNTYTIDNPSWTRKLARELSCPVYNPKDIVDCIRKAKWEDIIDVCSRWEPYGFVNMKWNYEVDFRFLPTHPSYSIYYGDFSRVPLLVGFTKNELDFTTYHQENNTGLLNDINLNFNKYAPEFFLYNATNSDAKSKKIHDYYLGTNGKVSNETMEDFGQIFSDSIIGHGVYRLVEFAKRYTDVYYYRTDYVGQRSLYNNRSGKPRGVGHADDLQYILPGLWYGPQIDNSHADAFMITRMTNWWTTFARDGVPAQESNPKWYPTTTNRTTVLLNDKTVAEYTGVPYINRYQFWDETFPHNYKSGSQRTQVALVTFLLMGVLKFFF